MSNASETVTEIVWRRLDFAGHEVHRVATARRGWILSGTAIGQPREGAYALEYTVHAERDFRSRVATITGWMNNRPVDLTIAPSRGGWALNGTSSAELAGCTDIDLGFSPSTNMLAIRRLGLAVGQSGTTAAAWLTFPSLALERLDQIYHRTGERTYRYEAPELAFAADLEVDEHGVVVSYPGLWIAEREAAGGA